ncbi:ATP-binding protein [Lactococcus garvieae]|nr:ATP-binding protein [Lactococcus garvieae]
MKLDYPIVKTHGNIARTKEGETLAFYTVPYFSSSIIDFSGKVKIKKSIATAIRKIAPNSYFEIALVPRDFLLGEKMDALKETLYPEHRKAGEKYLDERKRTLTHEMKIPYEYEWLIAVFLKEDESAESLKEFFLKQAQKHMHQLMSLFNRRIKTPEGWEKAWVNVELSLRQALSSIKAVPLNADQVYYHQRLQFLPHITHRFDEVLESRSVSNITDTLIDQDGLGCMKFISQYGESYSTIIPIGKTDKSLNNNHLGELIQRFDFPVGLKVKGRFPVMKKTGGYLSKMKQAFTRSKGIMTESARTGNVVYDKIVMGRRALNKMAKDVEAKEPLIEHGLFLIVSASTKPEWRARVNTVMNSLGSIGEKQRARFDQPYLFQSLLYGNKISLDTRFWYRLSNSKGFSQYLMFTTQKSGSKTGFPIGRLDSNYHQWDDLKTAIHASRNLVLYSPMLANKEDIAGKKTKNLLTEITGETGSGKTVLAQMILLQSILSTIKTLYIDPKHTLRKQWQKILKDKQWVAANSELADVIRSINFLTLSVEDERNIGILDPIIFLEAKEALNVAKMMLFYLMDNRWEEYQNTAVSKAVKEIVKRRAKGETLGFMHVIDLLKEHDDKNIRDVGESLYERIEGSILELAFSRGTTEGISFDEHSTILEIADLQLPDADNDDLNEEERNSVAVMMSLGVFCKRFGEKNENEETIEFLDEVWVLMKSKEGRQVVKSMKRLGRSQDNKLVLISQSVNDTKDENDTTGTGERFCFYESGEEEDILRALKLEVNEVNVKWISNMNQGQCIYRDVFGQLHRISIEVPPAWLKLIAPKKESKQSQLEQKYKAI